MSFDLGAVSSDAAQAILGVLSEGGRDLSAFARAEATKIATSLAEIAQLRASGAIDDEEASLHLDIQKQASRASLMAIKGISIITAEQAVNAAIGVVTRALSGVLPFRLP